MEYLFVAGRISPSEIRSMTIEEMRFYRDMIRRNHTFYGLKEDKRPPPKGN